MGKPSWRTSFQRVKRRSPEGKTQFLLEKWVLNQGATGAR
jgi:hypothetical protein